MGQSIPSYIELYSISDLHLGGELPRNQIFREGARAKAFFELLAGKPGPLALVIAGDLFDSLPYLPAGSYIAVDGAAEVMRRVINNASFTPVFDGLRTFLAKDGRELIILIGNHDLEIALPETQEELLRHIAPTAAARGRVRFSTSGAGFRCVVGNRTVFVTHGNEADPWNHVDHEALRKAAHARALGQPFDAGRWVPNAGTKLVVDVMNAIKECHPFIDLLKPEGKAAIKTLRTLEPKVLGKFFAALPAFADAVQAYGGPRTVLGARPAGAPSEPAVIHLLNEAAREGLQTDSSGTAPLMERVALFESKRKRPIDLVSSEDDATLGYLFDRVFRGRSPSQALMGALEGWLDDDRTFDLGDTDSTFKGILSQLGAGVDVVITGHTHLPRWIDVPDRQLVYLNAGAWARVIGLRKAFFQDDTTFAPVFNALSSRDIGTLDATHVTVKGRPVPLPLVLDAAAAAHLEADGDVVELVRITYREQQLDMRPVARQAIEKSVLEWL